MELLERLTDDQKAVLGGMAALFISGTIMSASYYLGRWARARKSRTQTLERSAHVRDTAEASGRKAA